MDGWSSNSTRSPEAANDLAQTIFRAAFAKEGFLANWKNRKRFLRFPNEPESDGASYGAYAGSGQAFQSLARALIEHLSSLGRERESVLQQVVTELVTGTSFDEFPSQALRIDPDVGAVVREAIAAFERRIRDSVELAAYFQAVGSQPLRPDSSELKELKIDEGLTPPRVFERPFGYYSAWDLSGGVEWWMPQLLLGYVYFKRELANLYIRTNDREDTENEIDKKIDQFFTVYGRKGWADVEYCNAMGDVKLADIAPHVPRDLEIDGYFSVGHGYSRYSIWLIIAPTEEEQFGRLRILLSHNDGESWIRKIGSLLTEDGPAYEHQLLSELVMYTKLGEYTEVLREEDVFWYEDERTQFIQTDLDPCDSQVLSFLTRRIWNPTELGIAANPEDNRDAFRAAFPCGAPVLTAAPADSIAGCILRNLAAEIDQNSLVERLVSDAKKRVSVVQSFVASELKKTQSMLDKNLRAFKGRNHQTAE